MPRGHLINPVCIRSMPNPRSKIERRLGLLAMLAVALALLLAGRPSFTNASRPPRGLSTTIVAMEMVRSVEEVDLILGDAPSPDREVMRIKEYVDFAFLTAFLGFFLALGLVMARSPGWDRAAGIAAAICAVGTAAFGISQNLAILRILDVPLYQTTAGMLNAIRSASAAKWALLGITSLLLSRYFLRTPGWPRRAVGALLALSGALDLGGLYANILLDWSGIPTLAGLLGAAIVLIWF